MTFHYHEQAQLPLLGGVVQAQRLLVPAEVIARLKTWRQACRLAWRLRRPRMSQRTFAELAGLYPSHVSDYFSAAQNKRELPARHAGAACQVLGNAVLAQWLAQQCEVTLLEELQAARAAVRKAA